MGLVCWAGVRESWQNCLRRDAGSAGDALHRVGAIAQIRLFAMRLARRASDARLAAVSVAKLNPALSLEAHLTP